MRDGNIYILSQYIRVEKVDNEGTVLGSVRKWNDGGVSSYSRITGRETFLPYQKGVNLEREAEVFLLAEATRH